MILSPLQPGRALLLLLGGGASVLARLGSTPHPCLLCGSGGGNVWPLTACGGAGASRTAGCSRRGRGVCTRRIQLGWRARTGNELTSSFLTTHCILPTVLLCCVVLCCTALYGDAGVLCGWMRCLPASTLHVAIARYCGTVLRATVRQIGSDGMIGCLLTLTWQLARKAAIWPADGGEMIALTSRLSRSCK